MSGKVPIFICWSGSQSKVTALALREWLPKVIQVVDPWMSTKDIDKGAAWFESIRGRLIKSSVGIACITPENVDTPWISFESGGLAASLGDKSVCPYLIGLNRLPSSHPLANLQVTAAKEEDTLDMLRTINSATVRKGSGLLI